MIVNYFTKIVYYEPINITIDAPSLGDVIIDMIVYYHNISNSIIMD